MKTKQPITDQASTQLPSSDNLCKRLAAQFPAEFARWAFGVTGSIKVDKTALNREPIRAAAVAFIAHESVQRITPSLKLWKKYKHGVMQDDHQRALACLFLNRTSFSGILAPGAGPLGGWQQASVYTIDCRYNDTFTARPPKPTRKPQHSWRALLRNEIITDSLVANHCSLMSCPPSHESCLSLVLTHLSASAYAASARNS